jgi:site-specific recombinase XerD
MHTNTLPKTADKFGDTFAAFLRSLAAANCSPGTVKAYRVDIGQFLIWLNEATIATRPNQVTRTHIMDYLASLGDAGVTGTSRRRKRTAIRRYFAFLLDEGIITSSPADRIPTPKREQRVRSWLIPEEYTRLLAAVSDPRDYAILQVFLQTGIRLAELCGLTLADVSLTSRTMRVKGKGLADRDVPLDRKATEALKTWLSIRQRQLTGAEELFINKYGQPLSERGVQKLVAKYRRLAGIAKPFGPHALRHTYGTNKAKMGVTAFQLQQLLGHRNIANTQIYVHLSHQDTRRVQEATSL